MRGAWLLGLALGKGRSSRGRGHSHGRRYSSGQNGTMKPLRKQKKKLHTTTARSPLERRRREKVRESHAINHPAVARRIRRLGVPPQELVWKCDASVFSFQSTKEVPPLKRMLGQKQALRSLRMGL